MSCLILHEEYTCQIDCQELGMFTDVGFDFGEMLDPELNSETMM